LHKHYSILSSKKQGILALVRIAEKDQQQISSLQVKQLGLEDLYEMVPELTTPKIDQLHKMVAITRALSEGKPVGVSSQLGLGRTGTILACNLVSKGLNPNAAIEEVQSKSPGSIETEEQKNTVNLYASNI
jgi:atypical dual specificity phosphatase